MVLQQAVSVIESSTSFTMTALELRISLTVRRKSFFTLSLGSLPAASWNCQAFHDLILKGTPTPAKLAFLSPGPSFQLVGLWSEMNLLLENLERGLGIVLFCLVLSGTIQSGMTVVSGLGEVVEGRQQEGRDNLTEPKLNL